jgi:hypothetical protein
LEEKRREREGKGRQSNEDNALCKDGESDERLCFLTGHGGLGDGSSQGGMVMVTIDHRPSGIRRTSASHFEFILQE